MALKLILAVVVAVLGYIIFASPYLILSPYFSFSTPFSKCKCACSCINDAPESKPVVTDETVVYGDPSKITAEDWTKWTALQTWLTSLGGDSTGVTLAYFSEINPSPSSPSSSPSSPSSPPSLGRRGVATTRAVQDGEPVVVVPFRAMMPASHAREKTDLGAVIKEKNIQITDDAILALFLLIEKLKPDSFWKPYIDFLPNDFSEMAIFFTPAERAMIEGSLLPTLMYEDQELKNTLSSALLIEEANPEKFKGLANETALKWALTCVWSRMWNIPELGGRSLVPVADLLNHHPSKGAILDPSATTQSATIKALGAYEKGEEFYDRYFITKVESDGVYFATYGFLLSHSYFSTVPLDVSFLPAPVSPHLANKWREWECGTVKQAVSEHIRQGGFPSSWARCAKLAGAGSVFIDTNITETNFESYVSSPQTWKFALEITKAHFRTLRVSFRSSVAGDRELLQSSELSYNMKQAVTLRMNEKIVLDTTIAYIDEILETL